MNSIDLKASLTRTLPAAIEATRKYQHDEKFPCVGSAESYFTGFLLQTLKGLGVEGVEEVFTALREIRQAESMAEYRCMYPEAPASHDCGPLCVEHGDVRDHSAVR